MIGLEAGNLIECTGNRYILKELLFHMQVDI